MSDFTLSAKMNELIQAVYHGPLEQPLWQRFLELYKEAMNANYATLLLRPPKEGDQGVVLNAVVLSKDVYAAYNETYFALDPFVDLPPGVARTIQQYIKPEKLMSSEYYQSYMEPADVFYVMGLDMSDEQGLKARLRVTRSRNDEDFGEEEKRLTELLFVHLQQAIQLYSRIARMETERDLYEDAIDHLDMGSVILSENAKILRSNQAAEQLFQEQNGLRVSDGRLQVGNREDNIRFRELIEDVIAAHRRSEPGFVRAFRLNRSGSQAGLGLLIRPLPITDVPDGIANPTVAIFISDPERPRNATIDVLKHLFEFTPSEAALALLLANGLTLDEAAEELGITRNTAKSHLSAIFSKTGVTRQPKLVQLILKSVASMG